ncbi:CBO0543 family protein [Halalkalibacter krulwichiae]|uniref:Uncharacterized protein n=1 Tax=Halalkalibacter krulwichiae TaxID=199441 RepID=A0A1X9MGR8_9BACI|nr:CBO0543 family protein [Halalkalibacter krulwichiae]ARK32669.1 hypothetical protein BkAM31D_24000 [Halalkalibacter krulwichiae]
MSEKNFLWLLQGMTIGSLPFVLFRKQPIKDWLIVFFLVGIVSGNIDKWLTRKGILQYPVRTFPRFLQTSFLFDYLLCPLLNVLYNQITFKDKPKLALLKLFLFITPMTVFELFLEKNTNLIKWKKGWTFYHTYISTFTKYFSVRLLMGLIRNISRSQEQNHRYQTD